MKLLTFFLSFNLCKSYGFIYPKMSIIPVNDCKILGKMESDTNNVVLVSGNGCRACMRFKPHFVTLSQKFDKIKMYEVPLNGYDQDKLLKDSLLKYAKRNNVDVIPTVIIKREGSVTCVTGSRDNIDDISMLIEDII